MKEVLFQGDYYEYVFIVFCSDKTFAIEKS